MFDTSWIADLDADGACEAVVGTQGDLREAEWRELALAAHWADLHDEHTLTPGPDGGIWSGSFGGRPFELRSRSVTSCSDGMSDRKYPFAVQLDVHGERRRGCAVAL